jgi:hypothetical protein
MFLLRTLRTHAGASCIQLTRFPVQFKNFFEQCAVTNSDCRVFIAMFQLYTGRKMCCLQGGTAIALCAAVAFGHARVFFCKQLAWQLRNLCHARRVTFVCTARSLFRCSQWYQLGAARCSKPPTRRERSAAEQKGAIVAALPAAWIRNTQPAWLRNTRNNSAGHWCPALGGLLVHGVEDGRTRPLGSKTIWDGPCANI